MFDRNRSAPAIASPGAHDLKHAKWPDTHAEKPNRALGKLGVPLERKPLYRKASGSAPLGTIAARFVPDT